MEEKKDLAQINAYVQKSIKYQFKLECLKAEKSMSDVIESLVIDWLEKQKCEKRPNDL